MPAPAPICSPVVPMLLIRKRSPVGAVVVAPISFTAVDSGYHVPSTSSKPSPPKGL